MMVGAVAMSSAMIAGFGALVPYRDPALARAASASSRAASVRAIGTVAGSCVDGEEEEVEGEGDDRDEGGAGQLQAAVARPAGRRGWRR